MLYVGVIKQSFSKSLACYKKIENMKSGSGMAQMITF